MRQPATAVDGFGLGNHLGAVDALAHRHAGGVGDPALDTLEELGRVGRVHGTLDGARVDCVDGGVLGQLAGPGARHGLDGGLAAAIDRLADEPGRGRDRGDVDDAAGPVRWQVGLGGLDEQDWAENVDAVSLGEVGGGDGGDEGVAGYAGVVDYDVDGLEFGGGKEVRFGRGDDELGAFWSPDVGLDGKGLDGICG